MKKIFLLLAVLFIHIGFAQENDYVAISKKLVESVKSKDGKAQSYVDLIANADEDTLLKQLKTDNERKAFFINTYNSFVIFSLQKDPKQYEDRNAFFKSEQFVIAGNKLSLDVIEHDFLRRSSIKLSLGKLHKLFPSKLERKFRVDEVDYRIHFALNCGAKSCPPVGAYDATNIDKQLNASANAYLKDKSTYNKKENKLTVTPLMSWFRGDFGNKKGVREICKKFNIIPNNVKPDLDYADYDWTLDMDNFR